MVIQTLNKKILIKLYIEEQKSAAQIAEIIGCSRTTIQQRCRMYGIKLRPRSRRKKKIDKTVLRRLYVEEGKSTDEIAEILGCTNGTIGNRLKEFGIRIRPPGGVRGRRLIPE